MKALGEFLTSGTGQIVVILLFGLFAYLLLKILGEPLSRQKIPDGTRYGVRYPSNTSGQRGLGVQPAPTVSISEVRQELERRLSAWRVERDRLTIRREQLNSLDYRSLSPIEVVRQSTTEERRNLAVILGVEKDATPANLIDSLRKEGSHSVASLVRGSHVTYDEVARDVAAKLGARLSAETMTSSEYEDLAIRSAFEKVIAKATPEQRQAILDEIASKYRKSSSGVLTAAGGLAVANLSGFGLYVAASTALGAITSAIGVTLPFAVYTGMSSALAAISGPVGWAALLSVAIFKLGSVDYKKTIPGVLAIASARARMISDLEDSLEELRMLDRQLETRKVALQSLHGFLEKHRSATPEFRVVKATVPW